LVDRDDEGFRGWFCVLTVDVSDSVFKELCLLDGLDLLADLVLVSQAQCIEFMVQLCDSELVCAFCQFVAVGLDAEPHESRHGSQARDRKSTRLNSSHVSISYAVFCLKQKRQ